MTTILITIIAYFIDRYFGEFKRFRHPIMYIKDMIHFYEERYYKNDLLSGIGLLVFMLLSIGFVAFIIQEFLSYFASIFNVVFSAMIASLFISYAMLYDSVYELLITQDKKTAIAQLTSKDAQNMSESDIYNFAIQTYAKNLHSAVVAPLLYLLLFGLPGILIYITINTMSVVVGYENEKYKLFGKATGIADDVVNYIPTRITAVLIMFFAKKEDLFEFCEGAKEYEGLNQGHSIVAMNLALDIEQKKEIDAQDLREALKILPR